MMQLSIVPCVPCIISFSKFDTDGYVNLMAELLPYINIVTRRILRSNGHLKAKRTYLAPDYDKQRREKASCDLPTSNARGQTRDIR